MQVLRSKLSIRVVLITTVLFIIILLLRNCGTDGQVVNRSSDFNLDKTYKAIPPDVTFICSFNIPTILEEIEFEKLRKSEAYIDKLRLTYNENPPFTRVFSNPEGAGINTSEKAVFYLDVGTNAEEVYTAVILSLKDANVFSRLASDHAKHNKIQSKDNYSHLKINPIASVAWNEDNVMFITTDESFDQVAVFDQVFNPKKEKYFDGSKGFYEFVESSTSDLAFWLDLTSYAKNQIHTTGKPGEISNALLRGNTLYGDVTFKNGEIDSNIFYKLNSLLSTALGGFFKEDYDRSIVDYIPNRIPSFMANFSFDIDGILKFLLRDVDRKVEARNSLIPYGLLLEDFGKALSGDVLFASFPNKGINKSSTLFGLKINDPSHFYNILQVMQDMGQIELVETGLYIMNTGFVAFLPILSTYSDELQRMVLIDDYAFVSLDETIIDALRERRFNPTNAESFLLPLNNKANYISAFGNNEFSQLADYTNQFSIKDYSMNYNGKKLTVHLNLKNKNKSSLKQLLSLN